MSNLFVRLSKARTERERSRSSAPRKVTWSNPSLLAPVPVMLHESSRCAGPPIVGCPRAARDLVAEGSVPNDSLDVNTMPTQRYARAPHRPQSHALCLWHLPKPSGEALSFVPLRTCLAVSGSSLDTPTRYASSFRRGGHLLSGRCDERDPLARPRRSSVALSIGTGHT